MAVVLWSLLGSALAMPMEVWARVHGTYPLWFVPTSLVLNYAIFKVMTGAPTYLTALLVFGAMNTALRLAVSHTVLHERLVGANLFVAVVLVAAVVVRMFWR